MSRINTNVQSLIAQRVLGQNTNQLNNSLERLSTGFRINRGKDDPAGLIASEKLKSEITSTNSAIKNAERADQVVNIAEGGLQEISGLLNELQGLLTTSANRDGLSSAEKDANQQQIDSILQTVDRLAGSTSFQGRKLLNGSLDYTSTGVSSNLSDFSISSAKFDTSTLDVKVAVTQSAQQAGLYLSLGGSQINTNTSAASIEIAGALGSRELSFASGASLSDIVTAINTFKDITGVEAVALTSGVKIFSSNYGSDEFVSAKYTGGASIQSGSGIRQLGSTNFADISTGTTTAWASATNPVRDSGQDIGGAINGVKATGSGRTLSINTDFLEVDLTFNNTVAQAIGSTTALTITGGGADFQLGGDINVGTRVGIGIKDVATRNLGTSGLGFLDELGSGKTYDVTRSDPDFSGAQAIVTEAIDQISTLRGRLGAFQKNVIGATIRNLGVAVENTSAANSVVRDTDFASETAALTRAQILQQASTNTLSLANSSPQSALSLLG